MQAITIFSSHSQTETLLFGLFAVLIIGFLVIDLGLLNRTAHRISTRSALIQSIFWVCVSTAFGYLIYVYDPGGADASLEFFSAYLTEYALSVDNIFVIILIFKYFRVRDEYFHKVLFWGILGAIVFRALFIFIGAYLVEQFHWILYIFGVFLVYSGIKIYFDEGDEKIDPERNPVMRFCRKYLPMTRQEHGDRFVVREEGNLRFTSLFLVIVLIETTDLIFAVDSIPAAFAITQNEFLIYTSNIFAVLGLRAMFFLLSGIIDKFYLLQKGLSIILFFIGAKMLLEIGEGTLPRWLTHIEPQHSFMLILGTLAMSILLSVLIPKKSPLDDQI
jgi:tellurite resistance protein TerC